LNDFQHHPCRHFELDVRSRSAKTSAIEFRIVDDPGNRYADLRDLSPGRIKILRKWPAIALEIEVDPYRAERLRMAGLLSAI